MNIKKVILVVLIVGFFISTQAQKYQINLAYSDSKIINKGSYSIDVLWQSLSYVRLGGYMSADMLFEYTQMDSIFWHSNENNDLGLTFALNANASLLPIFIKKDINWLDLYAVIQYGFSYAFYQNSFPERGFHQYYAFGGGLSIEVFKKAGIFTEVTYSSLYGVDEYPNWRFGINYRF
jgi:hypothetical protein